MKKIDFVKTMVFLGLAVLFMPGFSYALFDDLGMGARAPGMGNAFTAVADDLHTLYYNPAGLKNLERMQLSASHSLLYMGLSDGSNLGLSHLAFVRPLKDKWGVIGGAWQQFNLSGVYSEQTLQISYGNIYKGKNVFNGLKYGISLKRMSHSFSQLPEAFNAMGANFIATGLEDPVLAKKTSKSAFDADIGFFYQVNSRYALALAVRDILQPNMAFGGGNTDKIPMRTRLGGSYKTLWMTLASELRFEKGPTGDMDKDITLAAERIFPSLDRGQLGVRGALAMGNRDFRQISTGLSYRINRIQFDYAFLLPLGTIKGTAGTHRMAMVFHFGEPTPEEQYGMELLDQYKRLASKDEVGESKFPAPLADPRLQPIKALLAAFKYREASRTFADVARDLLPDPSVIRLSKRITAVAGFYPERKEPKEKWENLLTDGINNFFAGNDEKSTKQIAYALSLNRTDTKLERFLTRVEEHTHINGMRVPQEFDGDLVEFNLYESDIAFNKQDYLSALKKTKDALELDPSNASAIQRLGSNYYVVGEYKNALEIWEDAVKRDIPPEEKNILNVFINDVRKKLSMPVEVKPAEPPAKRERAAVDAREIEKLYQKGVEYYAQGRYLKAAAIFRRILILDPGNAQAQKALERIEKVSPKR